MSSGAPNAMRLMGLGKAPAQTLLLPLQFSMQAVVKMGQGLSKLSHVGPQLQTPSMMLQVLLWVPCNHIRGSRTSGAALTGANSVGRCAARTGPHSTARRKASKDSKPFMSLTLCLSTRQHV